MILLVAVTCLAVKTAEAQRVYKDGNAIILDLSVAAGMPAGAVTTISKTAACPSDNPTLSAIWSPYNVESETVKGSLNKTVYYQLEVAPNDIGSLENWATAVTACRDAAINGHNEGWRLPTLRESVYILLFRPAINTFANTGIYADQYWTLTEESYRTAWTIYMHDENRIGGVISQAVTSVYLKASTAGGSRGQRVRCVRELTGR